MQWNELIFITYHITRFNSAIEWKSNVLIHWLTVFFPLLSILRWQAHQMVHCFFNYLNAAWSSLSVRHFFMWSDVVSESSALFVPVLFLVGVPYWLGCYLHLHSCQLSVVDSLLFASPHILIIFQGVVTLWMLSPFSSVTSLQRSDHPFQDV